MSFCLWEVLNGVCSNAQLSLMSHHEVNKHNVLNIKASREIYAAVRDHCVEWLQERAGDLEHLIISPNKDASTHCQDPVTRTQRLL